MPLRDLVPSAQWTEEGATAALPPPFTVGRFLTGAVVAPMAIAAGTIAPPSPAELTGAITAPMAVAAGTIVVPRNLSGGVTVPMAVADGDIVTAVVILVLSSHIGASGEATTAMLTPPSGKTTGDFIAGRIQDDQNPADSVDIGADEYTEFEFCIMLTDNAEDDADYEFRITNNGTPLDSYP